VSPDAHKTARTAIYVVGGLVGLTVVGGIVAFAVVANTANNMANQPQPGPLPPPPPGTAGTGALPPARGTQINPQLSPVRRT
jgi:hypothetical protein